MLSKKFNILLYAIDANSRHVRASREWWLKIRVNDNKRLPVLISAVTLLATSGLWLLHHLFYMPKASVHLGSIETGVARTLSERNGDRLDREGRLALPRSYSYGYGDWYTPSIGNE